MERSEGKAMRVFMTGAADHAGGVVAERTVTVRFCAMDQGARR
ncbi:hypothetical protein [Streptomyces sp. NBC_00620]|nr:hypothetical protein [Streptomyces sp. NBC_00620]